MADTDSTNHSTDKVNDAFDTECIPADRAYIALQASWEIEGIAQLVHDHMSLDPDNLAHRALLRRCKRLSSVIMSALGEPDMGCDKLEFMLNDGEVANV